MSYHQLIQKTVVAALVLLILVGCSASEITPTAVPPTSTQTAIPPTDTTMIATGIWTTRADMPTPRWEHNTCVIGDKIYIIGGAGPIYEAQDAVEAYTPASDTWEKKSPMPTARQGLSVSEVNGKIYTIGGAKFSSAAFAKSEKFSTVEEYDPVTDTWVPKSPMPTARGWHSANIVDGKIYIFGGASGTTPKSKHVPTIEVYDPATDTWTQMGEMPEPRGAGSSSVVDGKIYFFGGYGGRQRVDEYDPATDTWTKKSDMPNPRVGLSTSVLDGKIYLIGGFGKSGYQGITPIDIYDPATDTWAAVPDMPTGRFGAYTSALDGMIYVFGGLENWTETESAYGIVEVYEPQ